MEYLYLAMTGAEIRNADALPRGLAYMACHFSLYGTGLSNIPPKLPEGSVLMVNDRTPVAGHDEKRITEQLQEAVERMKAAAVVLDLQRPGVPEAGIIARQAAEGLPCPVAVSEHYARELSCPVFLSAPELWTPMSEWLAPWKNREVWAEAALQTAQVSVTEEGSRYTSLPFEKPPQGCQRDEKLHTAYRIEPKKDRVEVYLYRGTEELKLWMEGAEKLGVRRFLGLYQQLNDCEF